jgi:hypothetical protein
MISPLTNTIRFLKAIGDLYKAFSVHEKGKKFDTFGLQPALDLVQNCRTFLEENEQAIIRDVRSRLPLNGPQGNVAGKTIDSVRLVEWGLSRLNEITKQYNYNEATLLSCMTLDVEHFHATTHFKSKSMTMLQYCRSFGNCVKESLKKLSLWSAHYFTNPRSWYPPPESAMQLKEIPQLKPLPSKELSSQDCQRLSDFASVYGRAVRQRSVRQETTMAKAGTLPFSCYETNLPIQKVVLRSRERLGNASSSTENEPLTTADEVNDDHYEDYEKPDEPEPEDEFDSDESDVDDVEDETRPSSYGGDDVPPEALFLVGSRSRFGRTVRFNGRYLKQNRIFFCRVS